MITLPIEIFYGMEHDIRLNIPAMSTLAITLSAFIVKLLYRLTGVEIKGREG